MLEADQARPIGATYDTNSSGRFDVVVYGDGLLAVKGSYVGVALRGAGAGAGAAGAGSSLGSSYEARHLEESLEAGRSALAAEPPGFFVHREEITALTLRKRWHGRSLTIRTRTAPEGRKFEWKPAMNDFDEIERLLGSAFGDLVTRE